MRLDRSPLVLLTLLAATDPLWAQAGDNNNLKQIGLALHNYSAVNNGFPPAAICDKAGKPLLSWRVAILPYLEKAPLHQKFKLDEPWDSDHNKKLLEQMPKVFEPSAGDPKLGETHCRVFFGGGALFDLKQKTRISAITDGTSNTFMVVETADSVPWTAPRDIEYTAKAPLPKLGVAGKGQFTVLMADGSVRNLSVNLPEMTLRAGITRAGGEVVNFDD